MKTCPNRVPGVDGMTVIAAVPLCPSLVAVIVAEPTVTPVTRPFALTVATAGVLLAQVTVRPDKGFPLASLGVAVSCSVDPTCTLAVAGLTLTAATGTGTTVMADVPFCPSLVAVIVAEPAVTPVTSPLLVTLATLGLLLAQVTVRPDKGFPLASFGVAVSCTVCPTCSAAEAGLTLTAATGTLETVMLAVPLCPSLVAVIVADPIATPVTSPLLVTLATLGLLLDHATARPDSGLPLASLGVAVSCTVCPTWTVAEPGLTVTAATGTAVTVMAEVPLFPSDVAVMVAEPAATPVTRPLLVTLATLVLLLDQLTTRPDSGFPFASFGVAVSCTVPPTVTLAVAGVTSTVATGTGGALPLIEKLQTVCVPASEYTVQLARLVAA